MQLIILKLLRRENKCQLLCCVVLVRSIIVSDKQPNKILFLLYINKDLFFLQFFDFRLSLFTSGSIKFILQ